MSFAESRPIAANWQEQDQRALDASGGGAAESSPQSKVCVCIILTYIIRYIYTMQHSWINFTCFDVSSMAFESLATFLLFRRLMTVHLNIALQSCGKWRAVNRYVPHFWGTYPPSAHAHITPPPETDGPAPGYLSWPDLFVRGPNYPAIRPTPTKGWYILKIVTLLPDRWVCVVTIDLGASVQWAVLISSCLLSVCIENIDVEESSRTWAWELVRVWGVRIVRETLAYFAKTYYNKLNIYIH